MLYKWLRLCHKCNVTMNHAPLIKVRSSVALLALAVTCSFAQAGSTEGYLSSSTAAGTSEFGSAAAYYGSARSGIDSRESARRKAQLDEAMLLLEEGRSAYRAGKYSEALEKYQAAWARIPKAPATSQQQKFIIDSISDASVAVAAEYAKVGRYDDAEQLLLNVLTRDANNKLARKRLSELRDPIRNNPALTPEHVKNVEEVNRLLTLGNGNYGLGNYDEAYATFNQVLAIDPYNQAARRGQEMVSKRRMTYYETARQSRRAAALAEVAALWEEALPSDAPDFQLGVGGGETISPGQLQNDERLRSIQVNAFRIEDATMEEALEILRSEASRNNVQLNIVFEKPQFPATPAAPVASVSDDEDEEDEDGEEAAPVVQSVAATYKEPRIPSLNVRDYNGKDLLQLLCDLSGCQYRVEDNAIFVYQKGVGAERMTKRQFKVPVAFLEQSGDDESDDSEDDDFGVTKKKRVGSIDPVAALKSMGVTFPKGSSAQFNRGTLMLTVINTMDNLDAVEDAVRAWQQKLPTMVKVSAKFVEISQTDDEELSFDWVVNPFSVNNSGNMFLGGVNGTGSTPDRTYNDFVGTGGSAFGNKYNGNGSWPIRNASALGNGSDTIMNGLMTGGNRSGSGAISGNRLDSLVSSGSTINSATQSAAPGILSLSGIYDSGSFQMIMRGLSQKKGVDVMSAPSLLARAKELEFCPEPLDIASDATLDEGAAKIEVIRRFIYPAEYEAPEINSNGGNNNNNNNNNNSSSSMPIAAPANPSSWAMEEVGIVLRFLVEEDEEAADVISFKRFELKVVDFEGFINYGSPITAGITNATTIQHIVLTENRIDMPVFSRRYINSNPCVYDGHTIAIGGLIEDQVQKVEDKVPVFGDLPLIGRFFRSNAESHIRKNLMVFVTAERVDPTGTPVRKRDAGTGDAPTSGMSSPGLFPDGLGNP